MIRITLTNHKDTKQEFDLPICAENLLNQHIPYLLANGYADVVFQTTNFALNKKLNRCLPTVIDRGIWELSILSYVLQRMNEQNLEILERSLPDSQCEVTELIRRSIYYCVKYYKKDGSINEFAVPLEQYNYVNDLHKLEADFKLKFRKTLEKQRLTGGQLFHKIIESIKNGGNLAKSEVILDYISPDSDHKNKFTNYEFDLYPVVTFGGNEGIYIDVNVKGVFDNSGTTFLKIGIIKTLLEDLNACKIMGELCGIIQFYGTDYINKNLTLFDSEIEIDKMVTQKIKIIK